MKKLCQEHGKEQYKYQQIMIKINILELYKLYVKD